MSVTSATTASIATPAAQPAPQPAAKPNDHDADDGVAATPVQAAPAPGTGLVVDKKA
jgi:hypothetical protein